MSALNFRITKFTSKLLLSFGLLGFYTMAVGQSHDAKPIPRDTSFNVRSTYIKERKKFPFIKIVEPDLPENVAAVLNVVYASFPEPPYGQRELHMDVFYPKDLSQGPFPCVVLFHGGGWRSGDRSHLVPLAQQLASKGYVAATVGYRMSMEALYPAAIYDAKASIKWLKENASKYQLDKQKVAVLGCSSGAQMALLIGATNGMKKFEGTLTDSNETSSVQAIVAVDGIASFVHPEAAAEGKAASLWLGGDRMEAAKNWKEASALEHLGKKTPPTLFINSSLPRFHAGRDDMIKMLDQYGIYSEVHTLPDTPHPFWLFHPWFSETFNYTIAFLNKVFK